MSGRHGCGFSGVTKRMSLVCFCFGSLDLGKLMMVMVMMVIGSLDFCCVA